MKLTKLERLNLILQYKNLLSASNIQDDMIDYYKGNIEILERGYEGEYYNFLQHIDDDILTLEDCRFVSDVLDLHMVMNYDFIGFDGHYEGNFAAYARFLFNDSNQSGGYSRLTVVGFDSHGETVGRYKAWVAEWERLRKPGKDLTSNDIANILASYLYP